jgi:ring-1,2-phenylacetyl-CoA epoxidase subunit PaaD
MPEAYMPVMPGSLEERVWKVMEEVPDPEIPTLSVVELGIINKVETDEANNSVRITMTPTFSGCPAIHYMKDQIRERVAALLPEFAVEVIVDFETPWNSNRISEEGLKKLKNFGLAPPRRYKGSLDVASIAEVNCPHCGSENTTMNSPFGPTLCRAIHYCFDCKQSFEQFKPL